MPDDKEKKGFSGLSTLVSEIKDIEQTIKAKQTPPPGQPRTATTTEQKRESITPPTTLKMESSVEDTGGSGGKWVLGLLGAAFLIWVINSGIQNSKKPPNTQLTQNSSISQNTISLKDLSPPTTAPQGMTQDIEPQSLVAPQKNTVMAPSSPKPTRNAEPQYIKPPVGTDRILSASEIRWCMREAIYMDTVKSIISSNNQVTVFNESINNYNIRCGSYRYKQSDLLQAELDIALYRSQIVSAASQFLKQPLPPKAGTSTPPPRIAETLNPQNKKTNQHHLTNPDLGTITQYTHTTTEALKEFQQGAVIIQNDWIASNFSSVLKHVASQRFNISAVTPKVKSRVDTFAKKTSDTPKAQQPTTTPTLVTDTKHPHRIAEAIQEFQQDAITLKNSWVNSNNPPILTRASSLGISINTDIPKAKSAQQQEIKKPDGIPDNARLDYLGQSWVCNPGFNPQSGRCVKFKIPLNAKLDYLGRSWVCNPGFNPQNGKCVKFQIPPNAKLDYLGRSWVCNPGFNPQNGKCVKFQVPPNAQLDYLGRSWVCNTGFNPQNGKCVKFQVPPNAQLDYLGRSWVCNTGYKRHGKKCIK